MLTPTLPTGRISCLILLLKAFLQSELQGIEISEAEFKTGAWVGRLPELRALPRPAVNGAAQAADFICAPRLWRTGQALRVRCRYR
jgi:hypothetical protein